MLSPERDPRARSRRCRREVGPGVTVVAATKYVAARATWPSLVEAGVEVVGENRAQDLEAKHAEYGDAFRWHFIGHLQSNKVKVVNRICELVHSLDSHSAARRLEVPALVQVNLAGEASKSGVAPGELGGYLGYDVRGLSTMPPARRDPRSRGRGSRGCARWPPSTASQELSMGTTQDYRVAAEEGATYVRVGSILFRDCKTSPHMALGDLWNRTLVYFGIAEEDDDWDDEDGYAAEESLEQSYRERPNVRRLTPRRRGQDFDDWTESEADAPTRASPAVRPSRARGARVRPADRGRPEPGRACACTSCSRAASTTRSRSPTSSSRSIPVILNLQGADTELSKRLIDFASGLTYALNGGMQRVADKVFLLTPRNVEVSAEQRAQLLERGGSSTRPRGARPRPSRPLRSAPSISAYHSPAVCSPANDSGPTRRASASSSKGDEQRARPRNAPSGQVARTGERPRRRGPVGGANLAGRRRGAAGDVELLECRGCAGERPGDRQRPPAGGGAVSTSRTGPGTSSVRLGGGLFASGRKKLAARGRSGCGERLVLPVGQRRVEGDRERPRRGDRDAGVDVRQHLRPALLRRSRGCARPPAQLDPEASGQRTPGSGRRRRRRRGSETVRSRLHRRQGRQSASPPARRRSTRAADPSPLSGPARHQPQQRGEIEPPEAPPSAEAASGPATSSLRRRRPDRARRRASPSRTARARACRPWSERSRTPGGRTRRPARPPSRRRA